MTCTNCGQEATEKFCPNCGQRTNVKRITFREGWFDFWSRVYGFDGMFPRTLRDLTIRPGKAARDYINGNRVKYYGPVGYFFLMITLFLVLAGILDIDVRVFLSQNQGMIVEQPPPGSNQEQFNRIILDFISENLRIIAFLIIPFNALMARYFLFRKSEMNFLEHTVLPFYLLGHIYWISIISLFVFKFTGSFFLNTISVVVIIFYFGFAYSNFITYQSKWKSFLKGLLVYIGGQLLLVVAFAIIGIVAVLILLKVNPDALELIRPSNNP